MIDFTAKALEKVQHFMSETNQNDLFLRITASPKKDEDKWSYAFALEPSPALSENDLKIPQDGFQVALNAQTAKVIQGAVVDWATKNDREGFAVNHDTALPPSHFASKNADIEDTIVEKIKEIFDPEIPVNIYDLGLIYGVKVDDKKHAHVVMTLTTPNCPAAEQLPEDVRLKTASVEGVETVEVELTWEPPWDKDMMSESALLELGL